MAIRQPFSKLHLANSSEPLKLGTTLEALCLKEIPYAQAKFMWDSSCGGRIDSLINSISVCAKCLREPSADRYLYGICAGQESVGETLELGEVNE